MSYLFGIAHDASSNTNEDSKAIVPAKRATRSARPTTHEGGLNLTRENTYWANPVNFNPTFSSTEKFYEDFSAGDRPFDRSEITRWEWNGPGQYTEVTFDNLDAFAEFSGLSPDFEIRTQQGPQPLFRGTYEFSSALASSVDDLTIRYRPQFVSALNEPYVDNPEIPWNELVASVYSGSGIQLNLIPSSFLEHAWRAGPETRLPEYDPENPPYMQAKIKVQGLGSFTGGSQGFNWQTGQTFPAIWEGLGFSLSANELYGGTGHHLILSNTNLRGSGGSNQWTSNVFNIPLDNSATGKTVSGFCYNRPGDYIWENISVDAWDEENQEAFYSFKWGTREFGLNNRKLFNCDFSRINQEHGSYVSLDGDFLKQGSTLSSIGSQGTQIAHRASPYQTVYPADNNPYTRRCTWTIRDNHYYNMADPTLRGERPAFTFTCFSPGNSQFPATVVAEDCSIVHNYDIPIPQNRLQSGEQLGGKSRSAMVVTRQPKDNPHYIYNVITSSVDDFEELPISGTPDQLIRVTNDASTYHWDGTEWENWGDVSGNPIDKVRVENCLIHAVKQAKNEHILLRSVNEIIFKHNCIIYDREDPSWIINDYAINIDAENFGESGHGQCSTSIEDSNGLRSKKLILANNIGVGRNGGEITFNIYHTKYRGTENVDNGIVYTFKLDATNNLGKYTVIDLEALDVTESTSFADLQTINGNNESSFTTTVDYDPVVHGAYPTTASGTGNHEDPPGAAPNQYLAPPPSATIESPEDGSVLGSTSSVTIDWVEAASANGYKIFLSTDLEALDTVSPIYNGDTDRDINTLDSGTTYVFKVVPYNFFGDAEAETRTFTTNLENPGSSPPSQSTGLSPENFAVNVPRNVTCTWNTDQNASGYDVYFGPNLGAEFNASRTNQQGNTFNPGTLDLGTLYYWRVDTVNEYGTTTGQTFSFTTEGPPAKSFGHSPVPGATNVPLDASCLWSEVPFTDSYRLLISPTPLSPPPTGRLVTLTDTAYDLDGFLAYGTEYSWRVDTTNVHGTTEGDVLTFQTLQDPNSGGGDPDPDPPAPPDPPDPPSPDSETAETIVRANHTSEVLSDWSSDNYLSRNDRYPTREGDIRKKIFKMTQAKNNISFVYRDSLRAMISAFNDIGYISVEDEYKDVKCLHANAERAIAKLKEEENIILPMLTISQTTTSNDDSRRRQESVLVNERYWDKDKNRAFRVLSLAPRPVNISYQLNVWCKYMADMDQILEQIRLKFNPEMNVSTKFSTIAKAFMDTEEDLGSMTAGDKEDRIIKKTFNIVFRTYVPNPKFLVTSTGKIEEFKSEIILP